LFIAPLSVLSEWKNEFKKWCPDLKVILFHGNKYQKQVLLERLKGENYDVILTNYENIISSIFLN
jgi:SNF2 family DNA or RNA helicase